MFAFNNAVLEAVYILRLDIFWKLNVEMVVFRDGKVEADNLVFVYLRDAWGLGEVLDEKLVLVD